MPSDDVASRIEKWRAAFCPSSLLQTTLGSPEAVRAADTAIEALTLGHQALLDVVRARAAEFDKEVQHHGALLFRSWEGLRLGILSVVLTAHGNYAMGDMATRAMVEMVLTGACMDRIVHRLAAGRRTGLVEPFDRLANRLQTWAAQEGGGMHNVDAHSDLATLGMGEAWDEHVRFDMLLHQAEAFSLTVPLGYAEFRKYVAYEALSGVAHSSPPRTELYRRMTQAAGGPFDFEPVFMPTEAVAVLGRLHRGADAILVITMNALADCSLRRPESRAALTSFAEKIGRSPHLLPQARRMVDRLLSGFLDGRERSP